MAHKRRWGMRGCAMLVLIGATLAVTTTTSGQHGNDMEGGSDTVLFGDEARSGLKLASAGKPFFDANGDGYRDFLVKYWTRAYHPDLRHEHLDVVFGRESWPSESRISDLDGRLVIGLPDPHDQLPDDPLYKLVSNADLNGDKIDDLIVQKQELRREAVTAVELRVFFGRPVWGARLDVTAETPDLTVRQPRAPRTSNEELRVPMPDQVQSGDLNGDGSPDLVVASCNLRPEGHTSASDGALLVYFGPYGSAIDLAADAPDTVIHSSTEVDVCTVSLTALDGDAATDLLLTGRVERSRQVYRYGAVAYGMETWPAESDIGDLVAARLGSDRSDTDVAVRLSDINGDRKRDVVGEASVYSGGAWEKEQACVWFAGERLQGDRTTGDCDYAFTDEWPSEALDINGDGAVDFGFAMEQRGAEPHLWRWALGPIEPGGSMSITDQPDSGDYVMKHPHRLEPFSMRFANVGVNGANDHLLFQAEASYAAAEDGSVSIGFGPLVPLPPTPVPTSMTPATVVPPVASPTPTAVPPTATEAPPRPVFTVYLPTFRHGE